MLQLFAAFLNAVSQIQCTARQDFPSRSYSLIQAPNVVRESEKCEQGAKTGYDGTLHQCFRKRNAIIVRTKTEEPENLYMHQSINPGDALNCLLYYFTFISFTSIVRFRA